MGFKLGKFGFEDITAETWALLVTLAVVIAIVALIIVAVTITNKDGKAFRFETHDLTYAAVCIAIAYALSFLGITLPQGGTITIISTLPIMVYCYYFGFRKGCIICTIYMLLQLLQNPYIIHPWSALLDYIIPYMSLIIVGIFSYKPTTSEDANKQQYSLKQHTRFFIGCGIYIAIRYFSHVMSGILFFGEWAWEGWAVVPYSFVYNTFALIDFAIAMVAAAGLLASRTFNAFMTKKMDVQRTTACSK